VKTNRKSNKPETTRRRQRPRNWCGNCQEAS